MMAATGGIEEERRARRERDELGEANDWDLTNGGQCEESEEAWVLTDARDHSMGKCVKFAADSKCAPQCFHQGKAVDETEEGAVCTKICRVPVLPSGQGCRRDRGGCCLHQDLPCSRLQRRHVQCDQDGHAAVPAFC